MSDERLEKLGTYFNHFEVRKTWGITFEQFIHLVDCGRWLESMESNRLPLYHRGRLEDVAL